LILGAPGIPGRLLKSMANLRKDRVPGPTLSHPSVPPAEASAGNGHAAALGGIALSLRLRTTDSAGTAAGVTWRDDTPPVALALDVLTASGGAPDPSPLPHLTARFFDLQNALLAARRLHWALQGLAENARSPMAASIAIHSVSDGLSASATSALESAAPGHVLLSQAFAETVHQVPGLTLRPASDNWQILSWSSAADPQSFADDENAVLALIRLRGREDPIVNSPVPPPAAVPVYQPPASLGRSIIEPDEPSPSIWKKPWLLVSVGVVVLAVAAVFIIRAMSPGPAPQVPPHDAVITTPSAAPIAKPVVPVAQDNAAIPRPQPAKPSPKPKVPKVETPATPNTEVQAENPKPPQPTTACSLAEADIALSLQRAARMMADGRLTEAQDAYQRLVGCPSAREKAIEGLRLVKQRMNFEGIQN
jgi:hypothetical protein